MSGQQARRCPILSLRNRRDDLFRWTAKVLMNGLAAPLRTRSYYSGKPTYRDLTSPPAYDEAV